jgi:hypothetical protein
MKTIAQNLNIKDFPFEIKDANGNLIYHEDSTAFWCKCECDSNGNLIYYEDSDGFWRKHEYDSNGNQIYHENSGDYWNKCEYDSNGNQIYFENSYGYWNKREYDSNGNETYFEDSGDYWNKCEYDSNGNRIYFEDSCGYWNKREYDSNGNETYFEDSDGEIIDNRINEDVKLVNEDESARQVLEGMGYYVRNLWSVSDVNGFNGKVSKEEALKILASALTHPYTMEVVFGLIKDGVRDFGYKIEDES